MKFCQFIVFLPILLNLSACSTEDENGSNEKTPNRLTLSGNQQRDTVFLDFDIPERIILAQRTGKLERLLENPELKKNSLIVQFDDYDAFVEISGEKETLKDEITNAFNNAPKSLQAIEKKWRDFANKLSPDKLMPNFPKIEYKEEAEFIEKTQIQEIYQTIIKKELSIKNYFQVSKEDGFITKVYAHTDDNVKKNTPLISYHPKKATVTTKASFILTKSIQQKIETNFAVRTPVLGEHILKKEDHQITYAITLREKVTPKNLPKYFIINLDENLFTVPKEFVGANNTVLFVSDKGTIKRKVKYKNGTYFFSESKNTITLQRP
ncbi:hypothetical protein [Fluviicola taffensis]|uniref:Lipoprotein n=1 Tax=Fluviicola taffensis (strain DSM 16823 / NCIMB 13979 / RW262) TaxID=755732 RepID=F2IHZ6_FLUTR|nr:hypothetical protein [Fluviicola taffensis]AEA42696.1 hypothetical protein Fluta_0692 [Fluviicola taffensis DSM 16823]